MELSLLYGKLIGYFFISTALAMLINGKRMKSSLMELFTDNTLIILTGFMSLIFGLVVVLTHPVLHGWPIIITIIGYITILRGIIRLFFTAQFSRFARKFKESPAYYRIAVVLILVLGILLLYFAYAIPA